MSHPAQIAVLGSGNGSNFQSLQEAIEQGKLHARIIFVASDNPHARILQRAQKKAIPTHILKCKQNSSLFDLRTQQTLASTLANIGIDYLCLAGFMRLVKAPLLDAFPQRIINIHPSLLPAYPGLEAWTQALQGGASLTGCTVHFVDAGMDTGEIIAQRQVPVLPQDTPESLHARIQEAEHLLYPEALQSLIHRNS